MSDEQMTETESTGAPAEEGSVRVGLADGISKWLETRTPAHDEQEPVPEVEASPDEPSPDVSEEEDTEEVNAQSDENEDGEQEKNKRPSQKDRYRKRAQFAEERLTAIEKEKDQIFEAYTQLMAKTKESFTELEDLRGQVRTLSSRLAEYGDTTVDPKDAEIAQLRRQIAAAQGQQELPEEVTQLRQQYEAQRQQHQRQVQLTQLREAVEEAATTAGVDAVTVAEQMLSLQHSVPEISKRLELATQRAQLLSQSQAARKQVAKNKTAPRPKTGSGSKAKYPNTPEGHAQWLRDKGHRV